MLQELIHSILLHHPLTKIGVTIRGRIHLKCVVITKDKSRVGLTMMNPWKVEVGGRM